MLDQLLNVVMYVCARPGFARLNLAYFLNDKTINFILEAVKMVTEHAWKLLPQVSGILSPEATSVLYVASSVWRQLLSYLWHPQSGGNLCHTCGILSLEATSVYMSKS